eukprot:UN04026
MKAGSNSKVLINFIQNCSILAVRRTGQQKT